MTEHTDPIRTLTEITNGTYEPILLARVAWACITEPGDATRGRLIAEHGPEHALELLLSGQPVDENAASLRERATARLILAQIVAVLGRTTTLEATIVTPEMEQWPEQLDDLGDAAPVCLWVRGDAAALSRESVAIIGARAASGYGEHMAMELTAGLVDRGREIVSGAAYGIDGMAHRAALAHGGMTVAVLAGGVDRYYPSGHEALLQRIANAGAVVSELPDGARPTRWRFLQRNRIIAALTRKTIVVEAGSRSGALNTVGQPSGLAHGREHLNCTPEVGQVECQ